MVKSFRFLLNFAWVNLGGIIGFAVIVIGGCYATGVPDNPIRSNLFETYYVMFPTMILLCLFLYAFGLCTNNLNLSLSMGGRRGDFFWALQGIMVFYTVVCWALQGFMSAFPAAANWEVRERFSLLSTYSGKPWTYPLLCMAILVLGCLGGLLMARHKILAVVVIIIAIFILMGATAFMILSTDLDMMDIFSGTQWEWLFTVLPKIVSAILAMAFAGGELVIWRAIRRYVVR